MIRSVSPSPTTSIDTRWPIKQVIYVMMENRSFDNLFGRFPGVNGTTTGVAVWEGDAADPVPRLAAGRSPARPRGGAQLPERREARRLRGRHVRRSVVVLAVRRAPTPQLLVLGQGVRAVGQLLRLGARTLVPEPLLLHRRTVGGVIDNPENIQSDVDWVNKKIFKSWGCDALGDDVFVLVKDPARNLTKHDTCFTYPTVGEQLTDGRDRLGVLRGGLGAAWLLLERLQRHPGRVPRQGVLERARCEPGRPADRRHRGERAPGRHLGHAAVRALRSPAGELVVRAQLGDRHRERRDDERHVGAHRDLRHVGRVGRLLRPRQAAGGRRHRTRVPRAVAHDLAVRAARA